jgi:hypothetical protein
MGQDKKNLTKLLDFVKDLYDHPDNKEFVAGIRAMVMQDKEFKKELLEPMASFNPDALSRIEKYLSLDYRIDSMEMPDYSLIKDKEIQDRLTSDFREMMRYRFGTRNHKIDFPEFCRYAALQIEMMVNYYYDKRFGSDIVQITSAVVEGNVSEVDGKSYYTPSPYLAVVSDIPLKSKVNALQKQFGWQYNKTVVYTRTIEVRNRQSHRSLLKNVDLIKEIENNPANKGADGKFDSSLAKANVDPKKMNEYWFQVWLDQRPFDKIIKALAVLCETVAKSLPQEQ